MSTIPLIRVGLVRDTPATSQSQQSISSPADVLPHLSDIAQSDREHFVVVHLDARNHPRGMEAVTEGQEPPEAHIHGLYVKTRWNGGQQVFTVGVQVERR